MDTYHPSTLIPKVRHTKHKNKNYKIIILKGFPGLWTHNSLFNWLDQNQLDSSIFHFGLQIQKIDHYVKRLEIFVNKNWPNRKIILLGFSMGGIIAVRFAQNSNWENIEKIITFAAPFKGSVKAAKYKILPATNDLSPDSKILNEIQNAKIPNNKLICVSGITDDLVDNSGTYLKNSKHTTLDFHGHSNVQLLKNIQSILEKELLKYKI